MNLKDFLENNPIINSSELARRMYPSNKYPKQQLNNKLKENKAGSGNSTMRVTESDEANAKQILKSVSDEILRYVERDKIT